MDISSYFYIVEEARIRQIYNLAIAYSHHTKKLALNPSSASRISKELRFLPNLSEPKRKDFFSKRKIRLWANQSGKRYSYEMLPELMIAYL